MSQQSWAKVLGERFADRVAQGGAAWQQDMSGLASVPCTVGAEGELRALGGVNGLVCLQAMLAQGWDDPRFLTGAQVAELGLSVRPEAKPVPLQWWRTVGDDGARLDEPAAVEFRAFNAGDVVGLLPMASPVVKGAVMEASLLKVAEAMGITVAHDQVGRAFMDREARVLHLPARSAFGSEAAFCSTVTHELCHGSAVGRVAVGEPGAPSYAGEELRAEIASMWVSMALGVAHDIGRHQGYRDAWAALLKAEPESWVRVARDAERMAATVVFGVRQVEREVATEKVVVAAPVVTNVGGKSVSGGRSTGSSRWVQEKFEKRQAVLALSRDDNAAAKALGAIFYGPEKLWFVPAGVDLAPFGKWVANQAGGGQAVNAGDVIDQFERAMVAAGLKLPTSIQDDGQWHHVGVDNPKKPKNKSGSYVLNVDGGRDGVPSGTIMNRFSGETVSWRFDGPELTPEQMAAAKARALEREAKAAADLLVQHTAMAVVATAIWADALPVEELGGRHGYLAKKGIDGAGLRVAMGSSLLAHEGWVGESGKDMVRANLSYLLVPMQDEQGKLWGVQAIDETGRKCFARGARKSGAFALVNGPSTVGGVSLDELLVKMAAPGAKIAIAEGFATGESFESLSGIPTVVAFDAGNIGKVAEALRRRLPGGCELVIAADNDQWFVEKALGKLAEVGVVGVGGGCVCVDRGDGAVREVPIGEAVLDGAWQQGGNGRYRVMVEKAVGSGHCGGDGVEVVRSLKVEVEKVVGGELVMEKAFFRNTGLEAAQEVQGATVVAPVFKSAKGGPTDWNDLAVREGAVVGRAQVARGLSLGESVVEELPMVKVAGRR